MSEVLIDRVGHSFKTKLVVVMLLANVLRLEITVVTNREKKGQKIITPSTPNFPHEMLGNCPSAPVSPKYRTAPARRPVAMCTFKNHVPPAGHLPPISDKARMKNANYEDDGPEMKLSVKNPIMQSDRTYSPTGLTHPTLILSRWCLA